MNQPFISKSKYLAGLQCSKLLWYHYNAKDKIPETDASTQAIFDQRHQVGELAKTLYAGGIEIDGDLNVVHLQPMSIVCFPKLQRIPDFC